MTKLSAHFHLNEFLKSDTALAHRIDLKPNEIQIENIKALCVNVLEPIRALFGDKPILILSGFRSKELNKLVGGVKNSHHLCEGGFAAADFVIKGEAAKVTFGNLLGITDNAKQDGATIYQSYLSAMARQIPYYQLILSEKENQAGFLHVSHSRNIRQALIKKPNGSYASV